MMVGIPDPELREVAGGGEEELVAETLILEAMRDAILEDASAHARAAVRAEAAASSGPAALLPPSAGDASRPAGGPGSPGARAAPEPHTGRSGVPVWLSEARRSEIGRLHQHSRSRSQMRQLYLVLA